MLNHEFYKLLELKYVLRDMEMKFILRHDVLHFWN